MPRLMITGEIRHWKWLNSQRKQIIGKLYNDAYDLIKDGGNILVPVKYISDYSNCAQRPYYLVMKEGHEFGERFIMYFDQEDKSAQKLEET